MVPGPSPLAPALPRINEVKLHPPNPHTDTQDLSPEHPVSHPLAIQPPDHRHFSPILSSHDTPRQDPSCSDMSEVDANVKVGAPSSLEGCPLSPPPREPFKHDTSASNTGLIQSGDVFKTDFNNSNVQASPFISADVPHISLAVDGKSRSSKPSSSNREFTIRPKYDFPNFTPSPTERYANARTASFESVFLSETTSSSIHHPFFMRRKGTSSQILQELPQSGLSSFNGLMSSQHIDFKLITAQK